MENRRRARVRRGHGRGECRARWVGVTSRQECVRAPSYPSLRTEYHRPRALRPARPTWSVRNTTTIHLPFRHQHLAHKCTPLIVRTIIRVGISVCLRVINNMSSELRSSGVNADASVPRYGIIYYVYNPRCAGAGECASCR